MSAAEGTFPFLMSSTKKPRHSTSFVPRLSRDAFGAFGIAVLFVPNASPIAPGTLERDEAGGLASPPRTILVMSPVDAMRGPLMTMAIGPGMTAEVSRQVGSDMVLP